MQLPRQEQHSIFKEIRANIEAVHNKASLADVFGVFVVIPALIIGIELAIQLEVGGLSNLSRGYFEFPLSPENFWSPSMLWKALISSYAHRSLHPHLSGNLVMYYMTMIGLYPLALISDKRKEFGFMYLITLGVLPFLIGYQNLRVGIMGTTMGFSGLVAALLGILPVIITIAAKERTGIGFVPIWTAGPVMLLLGSFSFVHTSSLQILILCILFSLLLGGIMIVHLGLADFLEGGHEIIRPRNVFSFWAVVTAIIGPYALFFAVSPETNLVAHLGGYLDGYFIALIFVWDTPDIDFALSDTIRN